MKAAGLKAIDTVVSSTAIFVKSKNPSNPALVELIASRINGVISKFIPQPVHSRTKGQQLHKSSSSANTTWSEPSWPKRAR